MRNSILVLRLAWLSLWMGAIGMYGVSAQTAPRRTLTVCLKELSARHKVDISFSPTITNKIYIRQYATEGEVPEILDRLLRGVDMDFKVVDGVYVVYPRKQERIVVVEKPQPKAPEPPALVITRDSLPSGLSQNAPLLLPSETKKLPLALRVPKFEPEPVTIRAPRWALKTNLLYDATASVSLGVEFAIARRWTIDVSGSFNAWTLSDNRKWKHFLLQPEVRYWFCERFLGHFLGAHLHGGRFNIGKLPAMGGLVSENMQQRRYQGNFYGAGVSYGYHWVFSPHWSLEPSIGLGYARVVYDKFPCGTCGQKIKSGTKNYFGPTKIAISLVYNIK